MVIEISTDTATICLFDKQRLAHRKDDIGDWWSLPKNELEEIVNGNALFLNLGSDGDYIVNICSEDFPSSHCFNIAVDSGQLYVGPGEETSGGGFEPDGTWGGAFVNLVPGNYACKVRRHDKVVDICFSQGGAGRNSITELIHI